jgi:hypothetical protein
LHAVFCEPAFFTGANCAPEFNTSEFLIIDPARHDRSMKTAIERWASNLVGNSSRSCGSKIRFMALNGHKTIETPQNRKP